MIIAKEKLEPKIPIRVYTRQCKQGTYDFNTAHTFNTGSYVSLCGTIHYKNDDEQTESRFDYYVENIVFHRILFYRKDGTKLSVDSDLVAALINALDMNFVI